MGLTTHQTGVMEGVTTALKNGEKRIILKGSAGVGKTFLSSELIKWFIENMLNTGSRWSSASSAVYVTAPTNKALSILQGKIPAHPNIIFSTIHSALKMTRDDYHLNKTGEVRFIQSKNSKEPPFNGCKICFLDECSMLNTQLLDLLDDYSFPVVFMGDFKQLNPVGEEMSPVFNRGYSEYELTEIVRQGAGNPIILLSRDLGLIKTKQNHIVDPGHGYLFDQNRQRIINNLAEVNGTDELKYLAYTNNEVDAMNKTVREKLYGTHPARIQQGETLVFDAPKGEYWTNKEVKVHSVEIRTEEIPIPTHYSKWGADGTPTACDLVKMKVYKVNGDFMVVHEHSDRMFKTLINAVANNCRKFGWGWKSKYWVEEFFAQITYNHAITVHKSQGSTYQEGIVNVGTLNYCRARKEDLDKCTTAEEREAVHAKANAERTRLTYTAVTRAAKTLVLYNA